MGPAPTTTSCDLGDFHACKDVCMDRSPLSQTCCQPQLWLWAGRSVYTGPSLGLGLHSGSVACLVVAIDGTFSIRIGERMTVPLKSALVPARLTHQVVANAEHMVFSHFDPNSLWDNTCRGEMMRTDGPIDYRHRHEAALIAGAAFPAGLRSVSDWLEVASGPSTAHIHPADGDQRIAAAVDELRRLQPDEKKSAGELADSVGLSTSRFLHVFNDQTGTSLRRYRLWLRMLHVAASIANGADLTTAAVEAGFASSSHLSSAFRTMFGLTPSALLGARIHIVDPM